MLILSRRPGEKVVIGEGENKIVITLLYFRGHQVAIGIEASKKIPVFRHEVWDRIQEERIIPA